MIMLNKPSVSIINGVIIIFIIGLINEFITAKRIDKVINPSSVFSTVNPEINFDAINIPVALAIKDAKNRVRNFISAKFAYLRLPKLNSFIKFLQG